MTVALILVGILTFLVSVVVFVYGLLAKKFVEEFMPVGTVVTLRTYKDAGKYGRYLGDFKIGKKWLCKELLTHHHAVEYLGQNKNLIKLAHLENRKKIV